VPHDLNETERAKLLARAQKLKDAQLDDFGDEARQQWNGRQANLFKYSGNDALLRRQLIDSGFAEVVQRGARSRPGIIKIWPNGDAPRYVPRERAQVRVRMVRETPAATTLNPKDVMKFTNYIGSRKETWRVEARRAVDAEFAEIAAAVRKLGFDRVLEYVERVDAIAGAEGWKSHLRKNFGDDLVEFFAPEIDGDG
jgi:hypothetical protein